MKLQAFPILLFTLVSSTCSAPKIDSNAFIEKFYEHQHGLSDLVRMLRADSLTNNSGVLLKKDTFNSIISNKFEKIGLLHVWAFSWPCSKNRQFDFTTNWSSDLPIHLYYNSCDTIETIKGFYRKDKNSNELWGLGDNWMMWSERKLNDWPPSD